MKFSSTSDVGDNILILSASSGSGHTRAAEALEKSFQAHRTVGNVAHVDALAYTNKVFHRFYSDLYLKLVKDAPTLWGWFYEKTDEPWKTDRMRLMLDRMNMRPLVERICTGAPHAVVCTHFLPAEIISYLISKKTDRYTPLHRRDGLLRPRNVAFASFSSLLCGTRGI